MRECLRLVRKAFTFPLTCLGIGLISTWTELNYVSPPITPAGGDGSLFLTFDATTIAVSLLIALLVRTGHLACPLVAKGTWTLLAALLLLSATSINLGCAAYGIPVGPATVLGAIFGGAGLALLFIMWWEVLGRISPSRMILCYASAASIRVFLIWVLGTLPVDRLWVCLCAVAIAALSSLWCAKETLVERNIIELSSQSSCTFPLKPLLAMVVGSFSIVFIMNAIGNPQGVNGNPGIFVAGVIVTVLCVRKGDGFEFKRLWQLSLPCLIAAVILYGISEKTFAETAALFASLSYEMLLMLVYAILGNLVYRYAHNATFLFAIELAVALSVAHIGSFCGKGIQAWLPESSSLIFLLAGGGLTVVFIIIASMLFSAKNLDDSQWATIIKKPLAEDLALALEKSSLGIRCHELAQSRKLSKREEEVLLLLARNFKPTQIASALCIETSTVNTHKKHIYQKLDVHSKKELLKLVG